MESFAHALERDALHDRIEETFDDNAFRVLLRDAARLEIEDRFLLQLSNGRAVRAADIVCEDFQPWDRIGACALIQDEVAVGLITDRLFRTFADVDHTLPHGATLALECAFE